MTAFRPSGRQYVHLSGDEGTAVPVGRRHGAPVVVRVAAERMVDDGLVICRSDNGGWLTDRVPASYLEGVDGGVNDPLGRGPTRRRRPWGG